MRVRSVTREKGPWGSWPLTVEFAEIGGRIEPVAIRAERPLTTSALRRIPLGAFAEQARRDYYRGVKGMAETRGPYLGTRQRVSPELRRRARARLPAAEEGVRRPGRPRVLDEEHFEQVARVYAEAWTRGRNPTTAVARWGRVSLSTAAKWVARARHEFGFLAPTEKGKAGGVPGGKGRKK